MTAARPVADIDPLSSLYLLAPGPGPPPYPTPPQPQPPTSHTFRSARPGAPTLVSAKMVGNLVGGTIRILLDPPTRIGGPGRERRPHTGMP